MKPENETKPNILGVQYTSSECGPFRLAIYNKDDELVAVVQDVQFDNTRPVVEQLVRMLLDAGLKK